MTLRACTGFLILLMAVGISAWLSKSPLTNVCDRSIASVGICAQILSTFAKRKTYPESLDYISTFINGKEIEFIQSNRSLKDLTGNGVTSSKFTYPSRLLNIPDLKGLRVLDAPSGGGLLTKELRENGIEAYGIDLSIPPELKGFPYFVEGSIYRLPFSSRVFDVVYCNFFFMGLDGKPDLIRQSLKELGRVTRSNGRIRILRVDNLYEVIGIASSIGLILTDSPQEGERQREFLEFAIGR